MENKFYKSLFLVMILSVTFSASLSAGSRAQPGKAIEVTTDKEKEIEKLKKELSKMNRVAEAANSKLAPLKKENDKLRAERARMHEEIGIAYTKAGLFDEAINAYTESLKYDPKNAEAHYYLGLLYQKSRMDIEKAAFHFKRYLYLNPNAKNKEEVKYIIEMIQNQR